MDSSGKDEQIQELQNQIEILKDEIRRLKEINEDRLKQWKAMAEQRNQAILMLSSFNL